MGGVCVALYGFIAVSGHKMLQAVDLNDNKNLFTVSAILIAGVGTLSLTFGSANGKHVTLTAVACALILGIVVRLIVTSKFFNKEDASSDETVAVSADKEDKE